MSVLHVARILKDSFLRRNKFDILPTFLFQCQLSDSKLQASLCWKFVYLTWVFCTCENILDTSYVLKVAIVKSV